MVYGLGEGVFFFFFNETATTEIYTLSLHDALPILTPMSGRRSTTWGWATCSSLSSVSRSEEHTSDLQSRPHLVCSLLLEKKTPLRVQAAGLWMPAWRNGGTISFQPFGYNGPCRAAPRCEQ